MLLFFFSTMYLTFTFHWALTEQQFSLYNKTLIVENRCKYKINSQALTDLSCTLRERLYHFANNASVILLFEVFLFYPILKVLNFQY